ncbi:MAG: glycosyltransferase family 2 protein [candidate division Zixibacteria bacterium]|nr:glycosyltransferase family 2 protein [candidate division Zixibacteria bacterium]
MNKKYKYKVSILILTFNNADTISSCLESLDNQTLIDFEIIIRDNNSADNTVTQLKQYDNIKLYAADSNIGFAAGINYLSRQANGEYLYILNPDCECPADMLEKLYEFAQNNPGVISPALIYPDGTPQLSARHLISYKNVLFSRKSPLYQMGFSSIDSAGYLMPENRSKVPAVSATALFIRNDLFQTIDGFDERFFLYLEDIDLCFRLNSINVDIWYLPDVKLKHILGASSSKASFRAGYYHHHSMFKYFTKHFSGNYIRNILLLIVLTAGFVISVMINITKPKRRK